MKRTIIPIGVALALASAARADFNPVALTPNSYTFAIVVPSNTVPAMPGCTPFWVGSGSNESDTTFYEQGLYARPGVVGHNSGVPPHNSIFTNINNPNMMFQMPPSYVANDDLAIVNNTGSGYGVITSGAFTFNTPTTATQLALLGTGGNGGATVSYTVNHTSGAAETGNITVSDWFNGGSSAAWGCNGRVNNGGFGNFNSSSVNNNAPFLYAFTINVSNPSPITGISLSYVTGGGVDNFFAVSGTNVGGWFPIPVTGFNNTALVPAAVPFPVTATMDGGTNILEANNPGNTWFEMGYDPTYPTEGLPPSGTTFTSMAQPTHTYQMGNYSTNCAVLIDPNHQLTTITPAYTTNAYTAISFLTAGANIGSGRMTNVCIIQHQDGVKETNVFYGFDWFNQNMPVALAYEAGGRVNLNNRSLSGNDNLGGGVPYLFETYFNLKDITSPVTNMVVKYGLAGNGQTTYILAVSGSTNPIPPLITQDPAPATQDWYPSQTASFSVQVAGSVPITNQWYYSATGSAPWTPLTNGLDANGSTVYGADTTTLSISNLSLADAGSYTYSATNAVGGEFDNTPATLTVNSGTPAGPIIDSQSPTASFQVLTNHVDVTTFSVTVDIGSSPPIYYQWCTGTPAAPAPIAGATGATYQNVDTNPVTLFCIVSNFVGFATSSPVSITIVQPAAPSAYQAAVLAYHPVAYWPLQETSGPIAFDYAGTNDGVYTGTCTLGNPGLPYTNGFGNNTSVGFDGTTAYVDIPVADLNIAGPMTVIQWVQPPSGGDTGFTTSLGHSDQSYRLDVAGGQPHWACPGPDVTDSATVNDGNWHQLVGVYNGTQETLYVDGKLVGSTTASGAPSSLDDVWIGGAPDYPGARNFSGNIAQVAILTNALTSAEVATLFADLDTAPEVTISPASPATDVGNNVTLTASFFGTPPTSLQWYVINTSSVSNNIAGATNASYTIVNPQLSASGFEYGVNAGNVYGTNSPFVSLTVNDVTAALPPGGDIGPTNAQVYAGVPVTYAVNPSGSLPISYQWLVDGSPVANQTNQTYTALVACGAHTLQVSFSNHLSGGVSVLSSVAVLQGLPLPPTVTFNSTGTGWAGNTVGAGTVPTFSANVLELTDGGGSEASDAFYGIAQYVGSFIASFTYTGNGGADGAAFILQNSDAATNALGEPGGALGYWNADGVMSNSIALEFNLYGANGIGMAAATNGNTQPDGNGASYQPTGPINIASGDPIKFVLNFANGILYVNMEDTLTLATFATNYTYGPLTQFLGGSDLAYVGFSAGDGGLTSIQTISNFEFNPPVSLTISSAGPNSIVLSWPVGASAYYQLETTASLSPPNWVPGPAPAVVGPLNQVTVSTQAAAHKFYRLGPISGGGCR